MGIGHRPSVSLDDDLVGDALEHSVERLARLIMHLSGLADRYEAAGGQSVAPAALARVARLRGTADSGRDALVGLALGGRTGIAQVTGDAAAESLGSALTTRTMIGQAQGVLMHRFGVTASAALEMLLIAAHDRHVTLREVADDVAGTAPEMNVSELAPAGHPAAAPMGGASAGHEA